ncbi:hypothetical protein DL96DRAFT_1705398 [Flagelloscypha sp. PMI_526]|nr:hypothetical protein DL96DRAFT_1705398 [Flagelloscypha sp. PMI_526]
MSSPTPEELQTLLVLIENVQIIDWFAVGSVALLVYDYFLTFGDEVELMWKGRFALPKLIFLWVNLLYSYEDTLMTSLKNRYFTIAVTCFMVFFVLLKPTLQPDIVETGVSTLIIGTVDLVLMLRVWVLYGGGKAILAVFLLLLTAEIACMVVIQYFAVAQFKTFLHLGPVLPGCYAMENPPSYLPLMLVPPLVVSVIMCCLTLFRCRHRLALFFGFGRPNARSEPVTELFLRDGTFWFIAVFAVDFAQLMIWCFGHPTLFSLLIIPSIVIYTILSSHALLNIKHVVRPEITVEMVEPSIPSPLSLVRNSPAREDGFYMMGENESRSRFSTDGDGLTRLPSRASSRRNKLRKSPSLKSLKTPPPSAPAIMLHRSPSYKPTPTFSIHSGHSEYSETSTTPLRPLRPGSEVLNEVNMGFATSEPTSAVYETPPNGGLPYRSPYAHDTRIEPTIWSPPLSPSSRSPSLPNYSRPFTGSSLDAPPFSDYSADSR